VTHKEKIGQIVVVRYRDHILFHQTDPVLLSPQTRETVGWLTDENSEYIILTWDRNFKPTLKGDPKASGLVLLRSDISEMRRIE
jgi:hypothetical protein